MANNVDRLVESFIPADHFGDSPIRRKVGEVIVFESEYLGDRTEEWLVVRTVGERKEVARYNVKYIGLITWMPFTTTPRR